MRAPRHRIKQGHWFADLVFPSGGAFTIGATIYVSGNRMSESTYRHELVHVAQFERYGLIGFMARYLYYQVVYGYQLNPLEVEARTRGMLYTLGESP